jgi:hypothetical protein
MSGGKGRRGGLSGLEKFERQTRGNFFLLLSKPFISNPNQIYRFNWATLTMQASLELRLHQQRLPQAPLGLAVPPAAVLLTLLLLLLTLQLLRGSGWASLCGTRIG